MNALGEDREEAIHDRVPLFGIDLLGEIHRSLHVGEKDRDLFPLTFESRARRENLLGEVTWGVRQRRRGRRFEGWRRRRSPATQGGRTFVTEFSACRICGATIRTWRWQWRCALVAKLRSLTILVAAGQTLHGSS